jgi:hypothetical protein
LTGNDLRARLHEPGAKSFRGFAVGSLRIHILGTHAVPKTPALVLRAPDRAKGHGPLESAEFCPLNPSNRATFVQRLYYRRPFAFDQNSLLLSFFHPKFA